MTHVHRPRHPGPPSDGAGQGLLPDARRMWRSGHQPAQPSEVVAAALDHRTAGAADGARPLELRDYLVVLGRRKWTVFSVVSAVVGAALVLSMVQAPVYEAYAEVLLEPRTSQVMFDAGPSSGTPAERRAAVETEIEVMRARSVQDAVAAELGRAPDVSIVAKGTTDVVRIVAGAGDPADAALEANTYAETYVDLRRRAVVDELLAAAEQVQSQIAGIDAEIAAIEAEVDGVDERIRTADSAADRLLLEQERSEVEDRLDPQLDSLQARRAAYDDQLDRLDLSTNLTLTGGAQIVSEAVEPAGPVRPTPRRNVLAALALGLALGVALAFVRDHLDDSVKGRDDVEGATPGTWVLALVPKVAGWRDRRAARVVSLDEPRSVAAEAYRTLRTSLQFIGLERRVEVVQVTSPSPCEGKTTTLANLGVAFASAGLRTVLVDADLRRPRLHEFFGVDNRAGLTSLLAGAAPLAEAVSPVAGQPFLAVLPSGPIPPNPSELLASGRMADVLDEVRRESDIVLVDSPPVLAVTDALVLGGLVDGVVVVATASLTTRLGLRRAVEQLTQVGAPVLGTVVNGAAAQGGDGGYGYGYAPARSRRDGRRWWRRSRDGGGHRATSVGARP